MGYKYSKSLSLNNWIRNNCKSSKDGLVVTDIDFMFYDYKKRKLMMIEWKTFGREMPNWQKNIYNKIHQSLEKTSKEYVGGFLIIFSGDCPETSREIKLNSIYINKDQLKSFLNFEKTYTQLKKEYNEETK